MKTASHLALLLALISPLAAQVTRGPRTAFTTPVGYGPIAGTGTSSSLHPGMNLVGLSLHQSSTHGSIVAIGKDFADLSYTSPPAPPSTTLGLSPGSTYIFEITSGEKIGTIQEITRWQDLRITLPDDLAAAGVKPGDSFALRKAATLNSVFDPRTCPLKGGEDPSNADLVGIPNGLSYGDFQQCFIYRTPAGEAGWLDATTFEPVGDLPLIYADGLEIIIQGQANVMLTHSGEIKPGPTRTVVKPGFNLVASPLSQACFLQKLGLENDLQKLDDSVEPDRVWIADGPDSHFSIYSLTKDGRWLNHGTGDYVTEMIPVGSAMLIERCGPPALFSLGD